jgi:hypothetical protein
MINSLFSNLRFMLGQPKESRVLCDLLYRESPNASFSEHETGFDFVISDAGSVLVCDENGIVDTIFFYSEPQDALVAKAYNGPLLKGIKFPATPLEFRKKLRGSLYEHRPQRKIMGLITPEADVYHFEDCKMFVEYSSSSGFVKRVILKKYEQPPELKNKPTSRP